jgi:hypothetical protein
MILSAASAGRALDAQPPGDSANGRRIFVAKGCFDLRFDGGTVQEQLARIYVMSLLHTHVLGRDVKVAHSLLQRRTLIKRPATACSEACIDDTNASRSDPNRCLLLVGRSRGVGEAQGS